jgi:hypothetical protein
MIADLDMPPLLDLMSRVLISVHVNESSFLRRNAVRVQKNSGQLFFGMSNVFMSHGARISQYIVLQIKNKTYFAYSIQDMRITTVLYDA